MVSDGHEAVLDMSGVPKLVQLPDADDAGLEVGGPVDVHELAVALAVDGEQDDATATDVDDGAIAESDLA